MHPYLSREGRKFVKILLIVIIMIFARFVSAADQNTNLPIDIEADVIQKDGRDFLSVRIVNKSSGDITIPKEFLKDANWDVWILEENSKGDEFNLRQLIPQLRKVGGEPSIQGWLRIIRQSLENPANLTKIKSRASFEATIPLEQALKAAKLSQPLVSPIIVQLMFSKAILSSQDVNETETVELYLTKFYTPSFILRDNKWMPFGQSESKSEVAR